MLYFPSKKNNSETSIHLTDLLERNLGLYGVLLGQVIIKRLNCECSYSIEGVLLGQVIIKRLNCECSYIIEGVLLSQVIIKRLSCECSYRLNCECPYSVEAPYWLVITSIQKMQRIGAQESSIYFPVIEISYYLHTPLPFSPIIS